MGLATWVAPETWVALETETWVGLEMRVGLETWVALETRVALETETWVALETGHCLTAIRMVAGAELSQTRAVCRITRIFVALGSRVRTQVLAQAPSADLVRAELSEAQPCADSPVLAEEVASVVDIVLAAAEALAEEAVLVVEVDVVSAEAADMAADVTEDAQRI